MIVYFTNVQQYMVLLGGNSLCGIYKLYEKDINVKEHSSSVFTMSVNVTSALH